VRKLLVPTLAAALLATSAATAVAATKNVRVGDNWYVRASGVPTVTVSKGTKVKWNFIGDNPHNVTVSRGPAKFRSSTKSSGSYSRTVRKTGTYSIFCTVHGPADQSMRLVVR
jgi:plastocyanin